MSITGNLRTLEFEELLQWLAQGRKTGTLTIANGTIQKSISLKNGRIIASASSDPKERLGSFLVEQGYIDDSTLQHALKLQEATQMSVGKVLVSLGSLSESDLGRLLRQKTEESIYDLFFWPEGEFEFQQQEPSRLTMVPLSLDVTQVLLEGMRRMDEWKAGNGAEPEPTFAAAAETAQEAGAITVAIEPPPLPSPIETAEESGEIGEIAGQVVPPIYDEESGQDSAFAAAKSQRTVIASVAAALLAFAGLGWAWVSLRASEPEAPIGESSGSGRQLVQVAPRLDPVAERLAAVPAASEPELALALAGVVPPEAAPAPQREASREEVLKARYEEELTTLRQELAEARRAAVEEQKAIEDRRLAAERPPSAEAVAPARAAEAPARTAEAPAIVAEAPAVESKVAAADLAASDQSSGRAAASSSEPAAAETDAGRAVERFQFPRDTSASGTRVTPPSAQPEAKAPPKPSPPPKPREPKTRRGDLVTAGPGVIPAQLIRAPSPRYPPAAQRLGRKGVVRVRVLVDENGKASEIRQVGPEVGMGFDKSALRAAEDAVWKPATKNGVQVKMWFDLVIQFEP